MSKLVLAPIDLRDVKTASRVLDAAVKQARINDSRLTVMTVVPDIVTGLDWRYAIRGETGGSEEYDVAAIVREALERVNEIVAEHAPKGMQVETVARHGTVYEQVLRVADEIGADQIVIGAHRPGLADFLLGPNTARVVRHAKCSVSVIRE